jgi:hypothetical protein
VLATFSIRDSRGAAVVIMKPVEDWQRDDVPGEFWAPVPWLLLVNALMRAGRVVEADKLGDQSSQVRLVEDEHMVEQLSSERPDEAFREGVHVGRPWCRPRNGRSSPLEGPDEPLREFAVPIADEQLGRSALRACCAHQSLVGAQVTAACITCRRRRSIKKSTKIWRKRTS